MVKWTDHSVVTFMPYATSTSVYFVILTGHYGQYIDYHSNKYMLKTTIQIAIRYCTNQDNIKWSIIWMHLTCFVCKAGDTCCSFYFIINNMVTKLGDYLLKLENNMASQEHIYYTFSYINIYKDTHIHILSQSLWSVARHCLTDCVVYVPTQHVPQRKKYIGACLNIFSNIQMFKFVVDTYFVLQKGSIHYAYYEWGY